MSKETVNLNPSKLSNVELEEALEALLREADKRELVAGSYWDTTDIQEVAVMLGVPIPNRAGLEEIMRNVRVHSGSEDILEVIGNELRSRQEGAAFRLHMNYLDEYLAHAVRDTVLGEHGYMSGRYFELSERHREKIREKVVKILDETMTDVGE